MKREFKLYINMTHDPSFSPRYLSVRLAIGVSTLVLILLFHHFLAKFPYGFAFSLFVLGLIVAIHVVLIATSTLTNRWAYLFLVPALLAAASESLHSSIAIRLLAPPVTAASLALFAFWTSGASNRLMTLPTLWPKSFILDTILPFSHYRSFFHRTDQTSNKKIGQVVFGAFLSIPVLLIFVGLFRSADAYFDASLTQWFTFNNLTERIGRYILDLIFGLFTLGFLWTAAMRTLHPQSILFREGSPSLKEHLTLNTVLTFINALFLMFVGFQLIYLFQGPTYIESRGITYASYARQGFFQLLAVAALVFVLTWVVYRLTNMRNLGSRVLNALLVGETAIIIISALKRLWMYVDVYGLSVARWWGIAGAIMVGILLTMCFVGILRKTHIASLMKWMTFVALFFVAICLLPNSEGYVARANTERFLAGEMQQLDYGYLTELSSDGLVPLADFSTRPWPREQINTFKQGVQIDDGETDKRSYRYDHLCDQSTGTSLPDRACLQKILQERHKELLKQTKTDWRPGTFSDYHALNVLSEIK